MGERKLIGPEFVQMTTDKVKEIRSKLKAKIDKRVTRIIKEKTLNLMLEIEYF